MRKISHKLSINKPFTNLKITTIFPKNILNFPLVQKLNLLLMCGGKRDTRRRIQTQLSFIMHTISTTKKIVNIHKCLP